MVAVSVALFVAIVGWAFVEPIPEAGAATFEEKVLHPFGALPDGEQPYASVIEAKGTLCNGGKS